MNPRTPLEGQLISSESDSAALAPLLTWSEAVSTKLLRPGLISGPYPCADTGSSPTRVDEGWSDAGQGGRNGHWFTDALATGGAATEGTARWLMAQCPGPGERMRRGVRSKGDDKSLRTNHESTDWTPAEGTLAIRPSCCGSGGDRRPDRGVRFLAELTDDHEFRAGEFGGLGEVTHSRVHDACTGRIGTDRSERQDPVLLHD